MISIKGLRQGLLIVFSGPSDEPWLTRLRELEGKLEANAGFFRGGQVAFDVRDFALSDDDLHRSVTLLQAHEVTLWAVISSDAATQARVRALGLADQITQPEPRPRPAVSRPSPEAAPDRAEPATAEPAPLYAPASSASDGARDGARAEMTLIEATDGLLVRRRVRSGQVLRHPGHVVVIGDVNPGAQLIAGGDIIVWGRLQGMAHAGALGDASAVVCALDMSPSLVKIADATRALRPNEARSRNKAGRAEIALLKDQEIVFTTWEKSA